VDNSVDGVRNELEGKQVVSITWVYVLLDLSLPDQPNRAVRTRMLRGVGGAACEGRSYPDIPANLAQNMVVPTKQGRSISYISCLLAAHSEKSGVYIVKQGSIPKFALLCRDST